MMIEVGQSAKPSTGPIRHGYGSLRLSGSILTIGTFDGVHKGHQALLRRVAREAEAEGLASVVYTFDPPPKSLFGTAARLTSAEEKVRRISHFGIDHVVVARFNRDYAARSAEAFLCEIGRLNPRQVWIGEDFRFGKGQAGDAALLARYFDVRLHREVGCDQGRRISSTRMRALIAAGRHEDARLLHGWPAEGCHAVPMDE